MKLTEMIVSAILKKGILFEGTNVEGDFTIPIFIENTKENVKIQFKTEHLILRIEKES